MSCTRLPAEPELLVVNCSELAGGGFVLLIAPPGATERFGKLLGDLASYRSRSAGAAAGTSSFTIEIERDFTPDDGSCRTYQVALVGRRARNAIAPPD